MNSKRLILIAGPTASGKTSIALQLAEQFQTEIISADSRQCYREMNIGVARPTPEQLLAVKHYFIASHSIYDKVNAAVFVAYADATLSEIFSHHDTAIMVGGTGLYIKAFTDGLDAIPEVPDEIRRKIITQYELHGLEWLQEEIRKQDPLFFSGGEVQNPQRLMRALEVKLSTGKSIREFQSGLKNADRESSYVISKYAIDVPRDELYVKINRRVDHMMEMGLLEEVKRLFPYRNLSALQTVGYSELFEYLDGKIGLNEAVEKIKMNTRRYAKRQLTWFRKDGEVIWVRSVDEIVNTFDARC